MAGDPFSLLNLAFNAVSGGIQATQNRGARPRMRTPGLPTFAEYWDSNPDIQRRFPDKKAWVDSQVAARRRSIADFDAGQTMTNATGAATNNVTFGDLYFGYNPLTPNGGDGGGGEDDGGGGGGTPPGPIPPGPKPPPTAPPGPTPDPVTPPPAGDWQFNPLDFAGYSYVPAALGGVLGALSAFGKDPVFDRHGTDHFWRDHYREQFAGAYEDARTDPYRGDYFRNANRAHLTATNAMLENSANLRARQAMNTGMMFGGGYSRDLASMAPGFYAQQAGNLRTGYDIRDRGVQMENAFVGHNTDRQQDLFQFEVANRTHSDYNRGFNLLGKLGGGLASGAAAADNLYANLWNRDVMRDLYSQNYGSYEFVPNANDNGKSNAAGADAVGGNADGASYYGPPHLAAMGPAPGSAKPKPIESAWNMFLPNFGQVPNESYLPRDEYVTLPKGTFSAPQTLQPAARLFTPEDAAAPFSSRRRFAFNNPYGRSWLSGAWMSGGF